MTDILVEEENEHVVLLPEPDSTQEEDAATVVNGESFRVVGTVQQQSLPSSRFPPIPTSHPHEFTDEQFTTHAAIIPNINSFLHQQRRSGDETSSPPVPFDASTASALLQTHNLLPISWNMVAQPIDPPSFWFFDPLLSSTETQSSYQTRRKAKATALWKDRFLPRYENVPTDYRTYEQLLHHRLDPNFPIGVFGESENSLTQMKVNFIDPYTGSGKDVDASLQHLHHYIFFVVLQCYCMVNGRFLRQTKHGFTNAELMEVVFLSQYLDFHNSSISPKIFEEQNFQQKHVAAYQLHTQQQLHPFSFFENYLVPIMLEHTFVYSLIVVLCLLPTDFFSSQLSLQSLVKSLTPLTFSSQLPKFHFVNLPIVMHPEIPNNGNMTLPIAYDTSKLVSQSESTRIQRQNDHAGATTEEFLEDKVIRDQRVGSSGKNLFHAKLQFNKNSTARQNKLEQKRRQQQPPPPQAASAVKDEEETDEEEEEPKTSPPPAATTTKRKQKRSAHGSKLKLTDRPKKRRQSVPTPTMVTKSLKQQTKQENGDNDDAPLPHPPLSNQALIGSYFSGRSQTYLFYGKEMIMSVLGHLNLSSSHPMHSFDPAQNHAADINEYTAWVIGCITPRGSKASSNKTFISAMRKHLGSKQQQRFYMTPTNRPATIRSASLPYTFFIHGASLYHPPPNVFRLQNLQSPSLLSFVEFESLVEAGTNRFGCVELRLADDAVALSDALHKALIPSVANKVLEFLHSPLRTKNAFHYYLALWHCGLHTEQDVYATLMAYMDADDRHTVFRDLQSASRDYDATLKTLSDSLFQEAPPSPLQQASDKMFHITLTPEQQRLLVKLCDDSPDAPPDSSLLIQMLFPEVYFQQRLSLWAHHLDTSLYWRKHISLLSTAQSLLSPQHRRHRRLSCSAVVPLNEEDKEAFVNDFLQEEPFILEEEEEHEDLAVVSHLVQFMQNGGAVLSSTLPPGMLRFCLWVNYIHAYQLREKIHAYLLLRYPPRVLLIPDNKAFVLSELQQAANSVATILSSESVASAVHSCAEDLASYSMLDRTQQHNLRLFFTMAKAFLKYADVNKQQQQVNDADQDHPSATGLWTPTARDRLHDNCYDITFDSEPMNKRRLLLLIRRNCFSTPLVIFQLPSTSLYQSISQFLSANRPQGTSLALLCCQLICQAAFEQYKESKYKNQFLPTLSNILGPLENDDPRYSSLSFHFTPSSSSSSSSCTDVSHQFINDLNCKIMMQHGVGLKVKDVLQMNHDFLLNDNLDSRPTLEEDYCSSLTFNVQSPPHPSLPRYKFSPKESGIAYNLASIHEKYEKLFEIAVAPM
jgi:hypothetical protein